MKNLSSVSLILVGLAVAACSSDDTKQDTSNPPFDLETDDGKDDSALLPSKGGDLRIAESETGSFTKTRGFIGYEIELDSGVVDIDLTGQTKTAQPLDTILYVFGPKKANGKYPTRPVAFNDDVAPGTNVSSHIVFTVANPGRYRLVVSTYDNWLEYPRHVSRGDYKLIVKCQGGVFGSCGPAVSDVGGACWSDAECVSGSDKPLHCEGEVTCLPGTECFFVRQGSCVEDYAWMTFAAKQCTNPWSQTAISEDEAAQFPVRELAQIVKYYAGLGIVFDEIGTLAPSEQQFQCLACGCSRGDLIAIKVKTPVAAVLGAQHGWIFSSTEPPAVSLAPKQCGSNPWQTQPADGPAAELELVDTWLAGLPAAVSLRGFAYPVERQFHCLSCSCGRGDRLLAFPKQQQSAGQLASQGFSDIYVP